MRKIHFIGIGGVGMNGLAQLAVLSGNQVSGSDRADNPSAQPFKTLRALGIAISPQDGSAITTETDCVVYSTAIEADNPELTKTNKLKIPLLHRAEFLKQLIGIKPLIAVAGTAGKTTTTGLLGWIFECLGLDPNVYNGAAISNWKTETQLGNIRKGKSNLWIIEADESDRSFLHFHPTHSIITNISKDHYELDELYRMFDQFREQTSGTVINEEPLHSEAPYTFLFQGIQFEVQMLGDHNLKNAYSAVRLCAKLGLDLEGVRKAVASFKGIERRLEISGKVNGITIIDDYAHNPAKIAAALKTASEAASVLHAFWRPHGFGPLYQCKDELIETFAGQSSVFILPVYYAGGTVTRKITSSQFVEQLNSAGIPAVYVEDYATLKQELIKRAQPGDVILGMGARDPELPLFAKQLVSEWTRT